MPNSIQYQFFYVHLSFHSFCYSGYHSPHATFQLYRILEKNSRLNVHPNIFNIENSILELDKCKTNKLNLSRNMLLNRRNYQYYRQKPSTKYQPTRHVKY
ncbi:hypothetical protein JHK82_055022 [Glycine max]|uniref:Uncharacterized protein n=1 Tax=Glycine max TaxID=3847 RepID=A0A0R0E6W9_SOYBN|nr:hypothetical protein JHK85_055828 [Glycine max]KAG5076327.1 hypothetical protein JHK82_055022 [Glycine max]